MMCSCGGRMVGFGKTSREVKTPGRREICTACGKTATIRGGVVSVLRGRPFKNDPRLTT